MTDALVEFLQDCVAADESLARAATPGNPCYPRWTAEPNMRLEKGCRCLSCWELADGWDVYPIDGPDCEDHGCFHTMHIGEADARHIAHHDPVRVLAECEWKRRVIGRYEMLARRAQSSDLDERAALRWVLEGVACSYSGNPGFQEKWRR